MTTTAHTDTAPVASGVIDWSTTRDDRRNTLDCTICDALAGAPCDADRPTFSHVGRTWAVGITQPGGSMQRAASGRQLVTLAEHCAPTVESLHCGSDMLYRGACLGAGCGWISDAVTDENHAVEDVHDHTHPGWRDLPIVQAAPHDAKDKQRDAWRREINRVYVGLGHPTHLTLPGGVIRTARSLHGTRSHWAHPVGGYDICGSIAADHPATATPVAHADTLF